MSSIRIVNGFGTVMITGAEVFRQKITQLNLNPGGDNAAPDSETDGATSAAIEIIIPNGRYQMDVLR